VVSGGRAGSECPLGLPAMSPVAICDLPGTELADALILPWIFPENLWLLWMGLVVRSALNAKSVVFRVGDNVKEGGDDRGKGLRLEYAKRRWGAGSRFQRCRLRVRKEELVTTVESEGVGRGRMFWRNSVSWCVRLGLRTAPGHVERLDVSSTKSRCG